MITDYEEYQNKIAGQTLIPRLIDLSIDLTGKRVLDVGCGHGGILKSICSHFKIKLGLGIDSDLAALLQGRVPGQMPVNFIAGNFLSIKSSTFDFVLLRDVLEHIQDPGVALIKASECISSGGYLYISYAPFYSPFGGHQHNGSGFFSYLPWIHLLPEAVFLKVLNLQGNAYKELKPLNEDILSVLKTRLTVDQLHKMIPGLPLKVIFNRKYFIRPDYKIKFRLPSISLPNVYIPILTELLCTGEELILKKE